MHHSQVITIVHYKMKTASTHKHMFLSDLVVYCDMMLLILQMMPQMTRGTAARNTRIRRAAAVRARRRRRRRKRRTRAARMMVSELVMGFMCSFCLIIVQLTCQVHAALKMQYNFKQCWIVLTDHFSFCPCLLLLLHCQERNDRWPLDRRPGV